MKPLRRHNPVFLLAANGVTLTRQQDELRVRYNQAVFLSGEYLSHTVNEIFGADHRFSIGRTGKETEFETLIGNQADEYGITIEQLKKREILPTTNNDPLFAVQVPTPQPRPLALGAT